MPKAQVSKLKRIFVLVNRGIVEQALVCVFPWEKPILEEIHGSNAQEVTVDELVRPPKGKVSKVKLDKRLDKDGKLVTPDQAPSLRESFTKMLEVDPDDDPLQDIDGEWNRLIAFYGRHVEVNVPNVEKVFGNIRMFRLCVKEYAAGRVPELFAEEEADEQAA